MSVANLKRNIKEVVTAWQSIGLHIVATVCDQMSTNCKALHELREDCIREGKRRGEGEYRKFGFMIGNEEVIPLFDTPHLLKGLRNNLLENDVSFEVNGVKHIASWKDIIKQYELDDAEVKMLNKLTDAHVFPEKMKKMKVSLAAQVLSSRVSCVMSYTAKIG